MWAALAAIVEGIIRPIIVWWSTYRQGRLAQKVADLEAARELEHRIQDATDKLRRAPGQYELRDGRVWRIPGGGAPPVVRRGPPPDPK